MAILHGQSGAIYMHGSRYVSCQARGFHSKKQERLSIAVSVPQIVDKLL